MIATVGLVYVDTTAPSIEPPIVDVTLAVGESARVRCTVTNKRTGLPVDLAGKTLVYAVSKRDGAPPAIKRACATVSEPDGEADMVLVSDDTVSLAAGSYLGRFWLVDDAGFVAPVSAVSAFTLTSAVFPLDGTTTAAPGEDVTLTIRDEVTFTAESEVAYTYAGGAEFATAVLPECGLPYVSDSDGDVSVDIIAYTTTGFTLRATTAFTGKVRFTTTGVSA